MQHRSNVKELAARDTRRPPRTRLTRSFLRLFEQIGRFDGRSRFSTWLYRLAVNHTLNRLRRRKRRSARSGCCTCSATTFRSPSGSGCSPWPALMPKRELAQTDRC
ncbi:MAG: RNA polymerase sigma factor [Thermoanaerobaculia bacterium]